MKKEENAVPMDEEQVEELNPINSEEALTLVRDVYSIRGLFIGLYNNRKAQSDYSDGRRIPRR